MVLELTLDRPKSKVVEALGGWAARESGRATPRGWRGDRWCVESASRGRVDVRIDRSRGRTVVSLSFTDEPGCRDWAQALAAHLQDAGAYDAKAAAFCPSCEAPISGLRARFCGRCGARLPAASAESAE